MPKFVKGKPVYTSANIRTMPQTFGDKDQYTVQKLTTRLNSQGRKALEAEYRRMRKIQMDRTRRMGKSEWKTSESYLNNVNRYPAPTSLSDAELVRSLHELDVFMRSDYSSIGGLRGIRDRFIDTMHKSGYTFINAYNYQKFTQFMAEAMRLAKDLAVTSDQVVELYEEIQGSSIQWKDIFKDYDGKDNDTQKVFEWWIDNKKKIKDLLQLQESEKANLEAKAESGLPLTREERLRLKSYREDTSAVAIRKRFMEHRR